MKIIGFSGYAQSGKDTAAEILGEIGYERIAFADILRKFLYAVNPKIGKVEDYEFEELELLLDTFGQMINDGEIKDKTFLNDDYTNGDWAEDEVKSLGFLPRDLDYLISSNINFDGIAEDLLQNYSDIQFNGVTFHYQEY